MVSRLYSLQRKHFLAQFGVLTVMSIVTYSIYWKVVSRSTGISRLRPQMFDPSKRSETTDDKRMKVLDIPEVIAFSLHSVDNVTINVEIPTVDSSGTLDGYSRAARVHNLCPKVSWVKPKLPRINRLVGSRDAGVFYCSIAKIGTTFWHRSLFLLYGNFTKGTYHQPYDVSIDTAYGYTEHLPRNANLAKYTFSFFFSRDPFTRLFSTFVDKLLPPNPTYWQSFGKGIIQYVRKEVVTTFSGHDVTFDEYIKYVILCEKTGQGVDVHFKSVYESCHPCEMNYTFIGAMETFKNDSITVLKRIGLDHEAHVLERNFANLYTDDAILDTINSPFSWKKDVIQFITWDAALRRIWLKLQLRGIVSFKQPFPWKETETNITVTKKEFIELARNAHRKSDPEDLRRQKKQVLLDAYRDVPKEDVDAVRKVFLLDFALFGYNLSPDYLDGK